MNYAYREKTLKPLQRKGYKENNELQRIHGRLNACSSSSSSTEEHRAFCTLFLTKAPFNVNHYN